jgi:Peptidase C26
MSINRCGHCCNRWTAYCCPQASRPTELAHRLGNRHCAARNLPGVPILAIADGAEKWNTALGGRKQEPGGEAQRPSLTTPETWERHPIRVRSHSTLADSLRPTIATQDGRPLPWELAFLPHQGIAQLADGLRPCAQSDDAPIVAFERKDAAFGLGVIGRLDWGLDHAYGMTLFDAFIQASKTFHQTRQQDQTWEASRDTICATVSVRVAQGQSLLSNSSSAAPEPLQQTLHHVRPRARAKGTPERSRQRSHPLTKTELNQMRRQRLKGATRP